LRISRTLGVMDILVHGGHGIVPPEEVRVTCATDGVGLDAPGLDELVGGALDATFARVLPDVSAEPGRVEENRAVIVGEEDEVHEEDPRLIGQAIEMQIIEESETEVSAREALRVHGCALS
jgi:hypothetical protein